MTKASQKKNNMFEPKSVDNIKTIAGHIGAIYDVIYNGKHLFTSSADRFVARWDIETGKQTGFTIKLDHSSYNIAFSNELDILAVGTNNGGIHVIDLKDKKEIRLMTQHKSAVFSLVYNPFLEQFYSGDNEGYFCAWDKNFNLLITLPFECEKIREIAINEEGLALAICGQDGIIRILETAYFNTISEFKAHEEGANCAVFDGEKLYSGGKDAHIKLWQWKEQKCLRSIPAHNYAVYDLELIDNKKKLVSASFDKSIKIWNTSDLSIVERIEYRNQGHRHTVNRIAKINEQEFVTVGDDKQIKVWKLKGN